MALYTVYPPLWYSCKARIRGWVTWRWMIHYILPDRGRAHAMYYQFDKETSKIYYDMSGPSPRCVGRYSISANLIGRLLGLQSSTFFRTSSIEGNISAG